MTAALRLPPPQQAAAEPATVPHLRIAPVQVAADELLLDELEQVVGGLERPVLPRDTDARW